MLTKAVNLCPLFHVDRLSLVKSWQPCAYQTTVSSEFLKSIFPFKISGLSIGAIKLDILQRLITIDSVSCTTDLTVVYESMTSDLPNIPTFLTDFVGWLDLSIQVNEVDLDLLNDTSPDYKNEISIHRLNWSLNRLLVHDVKVSVNRFETISVPRLSLVCRGSHIECDLHGEIVRVVLHGDSWYILDSAFNQINDRFQTMRLEGFNGSATIKNATVACTARIGTINQRSLGDPQFDSRITGVNLESVFEPNYTDVRMTCQRIESTTGYVEDGMKVHLTKDPDNWSGIIDVGAVYILAKQELVDVLITLYNLKNTFAEYELIYSSLVMPVFSRITVLPLEINVQYHARPFDVRKVLQGHFKSVLSLVPPCDMHIVFPETLLGNQEGWEALGDAYFTNLLKTQKTRCVRKLVKSYTAYKVKKFFGFFRKS